MILGFEPITARKMGLLRKIATNLTKNEHINKRGVKAKRRLASWDDTCLLKLLKAGFADKST